MFRVSRRLLTVKPFFRTKNKIHKGTIAPILPVPAHIQTPYYYETGKGFYEDTSVVILEIEEEIEKMRQSCKLAQQALQYAAQFIKEGVTTDYIDRMVHEFIIKNNAYPSPLKYNNFPKSICTSVNEIIAHGIPDDRPLQFGDVIHIDVTVFLNGYHGDCSKTFIVGENPEGQQLIQAVKEALYASIKSCRHGEKFSVIGEAVESVVEDKYKFTICRELCGHGIGPFFHGLPQILHYRNSNRNAGLPTMRKGMLFTIEPTIKTGKDDWFTWDDQWTLEASDGSISVAQEHTIMVLEDGVEILTAEEGEERIYKNI